VTEEPDIPSVERTAWLRHLIDTAESAAANLRARNNPTTAFVIADLDALSLRLRRELDEIK
jgi:hypothetical protein